MDNDYNCDELLSGFLLNLPQDNYDAVEELCRRYDELKPKLQPYFPNFEYLLRCFVSLSELLDVCKIRVPEPPLTGEVNADLKIIDEYFKAAGTEVARIRVGQRIAKLRHEIHHAYRRSERQ